MAKKTAKNIKPDRDIWKTTLELMREYGYADRRSVANLCTINDITKIRNPESKLPQSMLYNKLEFASVPTVARRQMAAPEMEKYDKELHLSGDYMLTGDWHIPFHDMELYDMMLALAKRFRIKKIVCAGDFLELDVFKLYPDKHASWKYEKTKAYHIINGILSWFNEFVWLIGNHEVRMWKRLQGMGEEEDIFRIVLEKEQLGKVKYSVYPFCDINSSWLIAHPKSYSRIQGRNAYFLASKYLVDLIAKGKSPNGRYGIVAFHGHLGGEGTDVSGNFRVADGMCMVDPDKVAYKKIKIDTSPEWRTGFLMLRNNFLYPFPKRDTDWSWWLKE